MNKQRNYGDWFRAVLSARKGIRYIEKVTRLARGFAGMDPATDTGRAMIQSFGFLWSAWADRDLKNRILKKLDKRSAGVLDFGNHTLKFEPDAGIVNCHAGANGGASRIRTVEITYDGLRALLAQKTPGPGALRYL